MLDDERVLRIGFCETRDLTPLDGLTPDQPSLRGPSLRKRRVEERLEPARPRWGEDAKHPSMLVVHPGIGIPEGARIW